MKALAIWTVVLLGAGVGHADEPANTEKAENTVKVEAVVDPIGYSDEDRDGRNDRFHDADGDGKNDITGRSYSKSSLDGFRFGRVEEERGKVHKRFRDRDGDGMNDLLRSLRGSLLGGDDLFIDEDGDGISDVRKLRLQDQARGVQLKKLQERMRRRRAKPPPKERPRPKRQEERRR